MKLYSEREYPQNYEDRDREITDKVWDAIKVIIKRMFDNNTFIKLAPEYGNVDWENRIIGTNYSDFNKLFKANISCLEDDVFTYSITSISPFDNKEEKNNFNKCLIALDIIQFACSNIVDVEEKSSQSGRLYYKVKDTNENKRHFINEVNDIFRRNRIAYELTEDGEIKRVLNEALTTMLKNDITVKDESLREMLNTAKTKIFDKSFEERKIALEKLVDAFERIKTMYSNKNKDKSMNTLLNKMSGDTASSKNTESVLYCESRVLTKIYNNKFMIRHTEKNKVPIDNNNLMEYLYQRLYAFVYWSVKVLKDEDKL